MDVDGGRIPGSGVAPSRECVTCERSGSVNVHGWSTSQRAKAWLMAIASCA